MENIERKRTICWDDPKDCLRNITTISGLDYLTAVKNGKINFPPAAMLVGYTISEVTEGYAAFELVPGEYHYNPLSTIHGGIISTLLDSTMTASIVSMLPKDKDCVTVEIKVNFIRPVTTETEVIRCEAKTIHVGKRLATAEGQVKDKYGKLYAHGLSTFSII
jgi:uncharacterized protein (TIGR00369 family)